MSKKILIVEDEKKIARFLQLELEREGYACMLDFTGENVVDYVGQQHFDLVLLDLMLPKGEGLTICKRIREISNVPILVLSARDEIAWKVKVLDMGADDYLTKPFSSKELLARIRVLLRRKTSDDKLNEISIYLQDLYIYQERHEVRIGSLSINLTKKEFDLLTFLVKNKNIVLGRDRILAEVWGYNYVGATNIVDVYIRYLRSKIDEVVDKKYIYTVRGIGYVARD